MTVTWAWVGAVTASTAWVRGQVSGSSVRLAVDTDPGMGSPTFFGPVSPSGAGIASILATGLSPATQYHWALEVDSTLDTDWQGSVRTHPPQGEPTTVRLWAGSCAGSGSSDWITSRVSNHPAFDSARTGGFDFGIHMGDLHYRDIGSGTHVSPPFNAAKYRAAYHDVLTFNGTAGAGARQGRLYRSTGLVYFWDDHDYGPNDSDGSLPHKGEAALAYRQCVPHYPLPDAQGAVYQSFQVGRVLFVCLDVRFHKSPSTMLGSAQRAWLRDLLGSSSAAFLVLTMGSQWSRATGTHADSWAAYPAERNELVEMFHDLGWSHRMCVVQGDNHAVGIDNGANIPGGMPLFQFAPFDSNPSNPTSSSRFNTFISGGQRGQWGSLEIVDHGDQIEVTGTAYRLGDELSSYTFVASPTSTPAPPPPEVPPAPPAVAQAHIRRAVTWLGVHAVTGRIIAELPDVRGEVSRLLSAYSSSSLTLPLPLSGPGHVPVQLVEQATAPRDTALVAIVNDLPVWMGWVLGRRGGTGAELTLATVTPEGYLRRRRVRDHEFTQTDRALVAAELVGDAGPIGGVGQGLGYTLDVALTGDLIDREYVATDRQTVYDALRELAADGLEFTADFDWIDADQTSVRKILRIRPRIGRAETGTLFETSASSMFEARSGSEATYDLVEDWGDGKGANWVQAYAAGEGEDQPESAPAVDRVALDGGAPIVEHHYQPSATVTGQGALDRHAAAELARLHRGAEVWQIEARWDAYPRPGVDVMLGDDVSWQLHGHRHPAGVTGRGRMIGWELDVQAGRWRPILLDPQEV